MVWVWPVSRNTKNKTGLIEARVAMGIAIVVSVLFNTIGNPPVQLLSVLAIWFAKFGINSLFKTFQKQTLLVQGIEHF